MLRWQAVPSASGYNLLVSKTNTFADTIVSVSNIVGTSYTFTAPLSENSQYYWRVTPLNTCGTGVTSAGYSFRTGSVYCGGDTVRSANVPVAIAVGVNTVTSMLNIPASGGIINDVDVVGLKITRGRLFDLAFSLKSPAGTSAMLIVNPCASGEANMNINLDDEATSANIPCPATGGVVRRPTEPLSRFDGENSTGEWTLTIFNSYPSSVGSLDGWGLRICTYTASALPVNWLSFTGKKMASSIQLNWVTANELKNDHYELERSADGGMFAVIGTIEAGKNVNTTLQYLYTDLKPFSGVNYYRLKQVDKGGNFTYSAIVKVVMDQGQWLWTLYPNPAKDFTILRALDDLGKVQITLSDASGKLVQTQYRLAVKPGELIKIPLNTFSKGIYLVKIESDREVKTEKIVVE